MPLLDGVFFRFLYSWDTMGVVRMSDELEKINQSRIMKLESQISELEKNCEVSFAKVENHIERILKVIDIQAQSTEMLTDQIAELKEQIENIWAYLPSDLGEQLKELKEASSASHTVEDITCPNCKMIFSHPNEFNEPKGILPKGDDFMAEDDGEDDKISGIDTVCLKCGTTLNYLFPSTKQLISEFVEKLKKGFNNHFTIEALDKFYKYKNAYQSLQEWFELTIKEYQEKLK